MPLSVVLVAASLVLHVLYEQFTASGFEGGCVVFLRPLMLFTMCTMFDLLSLIFIERIVFLSVLRICFCLSVII